ncbi:hypothetical protein [Clostridium lacusfryxellense]|uniref:hypothetical protein n=1 Tax=Clostridium lacusfryxellense TaxID=205328 RepID=UPI001C0DF881|nr:hypothetical protein [Clostridium lacusfryxellense]MBU3110086.1 hypothetical protein [Clostridium lacusfryxellense]
MDENNLEKTEKSTGISNDDSMNIDNDVEQKVIKQSSADLINEVNETIMKDEMNLF